MALTKENIPTETGKKLFDLLAEVAEQQKYFDPETFIFCILSELKGDANKQKMIDAIEKDNIRDISTLNLLCIDIADGLEV